MASALRQTARLLRVRGALSNQAQERYFFRGSGFDRSLVRDVERMMNNVARTFDANLFPFWHTNMPRVLPVSSVGEDRKPTYRLNIDMGNFNPEDIKISLKDRYLSINAKSDRKCEDGSRYYQETTREYLLPESVKVEELKSLLTDDGILCIEAPLPEPEKPKEIPIERGGEEPKQQERLA